MKTYTAILAIAAVSILSTGCDPGDTWLVITGNVERECDVSQFAESTVVNNSGETMLVAFCRNGEVISGGAWVVSQNDKMTRKVKVKDEVDKEWMNAADSCETKSLRPTVDEELVPNLIGNNVADFHICRRTRAHSYGPGEFTILKASDVCPASYEELSGTALACAN